MARSRSGTSSRRSTRAARIALHRFIFALGIRHIGETNARLLARNYGTYAAFEAAMVAAAEGDADALDELDSINGIGETVAQALVDFYGEAHNLAGGRRAAGRGHGRAGRGGRLDLAGRPGRPWCSPARSSG